jgi:hypothetical protein
VNVSEIFKSPRLVVMRSAYEAWDEPGMPEFFHEMVRLKRLGYGRNYPVGVLPVDTTDMIAHHVLLLDEGRDGRPRALMGYKSTNLSACDAYNLTFPGMSLVRSAGADLHARAMERIVRRCRTEGRDLAYLGSWTVDPEVESPALKQALREIFLSTYCLLYETQGVSEVVIGGTLRFRTEHVFRRLGHQPLAWRRKALPTIRVAHLMGEEVQVMHARRFNEELRPVVERWRYLWEARRIIEPSASAVRLLAG